MGDDPVTATEIAKKYNDVDLAQYFRSVRPYGETPEPPRSDSLSAKEAHELVASITYKPGWFFTINYDPGFQGFEFLIMTSVPDSGDPKRMIQVMHKELMEARVLDAREFFVERIFRCIQNAELHETKEFFRVGGVQPYNPHH